MARRRKSSKKEVSLFPFLDILGCLIGSLILIITTVVLEQMDTQPVAEAGRIDDLRQQASRAQSRRATAEKRLAELEKQEEATDARLSQARRRAEDAERAAFAARQRLAAAERLVVEKPPAIKPVDTAPLAARKKKLDAEIATIQAEIAERRKRPEQAIVVLPPGSGGGPKRGFFVETANGRVVVHDPKKPWEVAADKAAGDARFKELLARAAKDKDAIVTFLVRPDGIATYQAVQRVASAAGARTGRVPLPGGGAVDLSETR